MLSCKTSRFGTFAPWRDPIQAGTRASGHDAAANRRPTASGGVLVIGKHFIDDASGLSCFYGVGVYVFGKCNQALP